MSYIFIPSLARILCFLLILAVVCLVISKRGRRQPPAIEDETDVLRELRQQKENLEQRLSNLETILMSKMQ